MQLQPPLFFYIDIRTATNIESVFNSYHSIYIAARGNGDSVNGCGGAVVEVGGDY